MLTQVNLLERFERCASRPLRSGETLYAEIDLSIPFDELWIAVCEKRLSILSRVDFKPFEEGYAVSRSASHELSAAITRFPSDVNGLGELCGEVFGGLQLCVVSHEVNESGYASTVVATSSAPSPLRDWVSGFRRLLDQAVDEQCLVNDARHFLNWGKVATRMTDQLQGAQEPRVVDMHLPIGLRAAIARCGAETVQQVLQLDEARILAELKGTEQEKKELMCALRLELRKSVG